MCAAVGASDLPIEMLWDGSTWSSSGAPNDGFAGSINTVSCVSPQRCAVVGEEAQSDYTDATIALSGFLNGSQWKVSPLGLASDLNSVSCAASNECTAVNLKAVHWNGRNWTIQAKFAAQMNGVSCVRSSCMAVGQNPSTELPAAAEYVK
jgi:hypothetical protein